MADDSTVFMTDGTARDRLVLLPGSMIAGRYRVVHLVGEGGMGKVYRAEDLKLGQTVALKFISPERANDERWLRRFYSEVRNARSVSHQYVCRVHDIFDHEGSTFLSMEYVDGEDLASLLRRIGHPPVEKATALASEICSGLAAVHASGIIHRDLKPANIMIDGRGQARITDFGLATAGEEGAAAREVVGTPAYMAPEQLEGAAATVQTDLYALGLVLYELHTGQRPESLRTSESQRKAITPPAKLIPELRREANDIILRCLQPDPRERPASAQQVSAAFPFDPLAEALVGNQTPAPNLVASVRGPELTRRAAWTWFAAVLAGLGLMFAMAPYMEEVSSAPLLKSPEVLAERTRQIVREFGYPAPAGDVYYRLDRNRAMIGYRAGQSPPLGLTTLNTAEQGVAVLDYRQTESHSLSNLSSTNSVSFPDPATEVGDITVRIDSRGQLLRFQAVPDPKAQSASHPDWSVAIRAAGLEESSLQPSSRKGFVPYTYEERRDWEATYPGHPGVPIHVLATAAGGRLNYFEVLSPWNSARASNSMSHDTLNIVARATPAVVALVVLIVGLAVAQRNLRSQRADRSGGFRVAAFIFIVGLASRILYSHFPWGVLPMTEAISRLAAGALFSATFVWVSYMAVEPFIRKRVPHVLSSWIRLLEGRYLDSAVGRDVLIGSLLGVLLELGTSACWYLPAWFQVPLDTPRTPFWEYMIGFQGWFAGVFDSAQYAVFDALGTLTFFCLARLLLRHNRAAIGLTAAFLTAAGTGGGPLLLGITAGLFVSAICLLALLRFGLLAYVACLFVYFVLIKFPHTLKLEYWYSTESLLMGLLVVGFATFGLWRSVGNQSLFGELSMD